MASFPSRARDDTQAPIGRDALQLLNQAMYLPFDAIRAQHAQAIHAGFMANSILESRDFENGVDALEHIWLGPFARSKA
jgi:acetyl/propionyl-CoA carboxylase alpha subunit